MMLFKDRADAGRQLAALLSGYKTAKPIVLGLPRGGVPVAYEVARALDAPLDVAVVRKVGAPDQPELAVGAVAEDGVLIVNEEVRLAYALDQAELDELAAVKHAEVSERVRKFRQGRPPPQLAGRTVILVDDGIATGATALAAVAWVRRQQPARLVLAAGVVPKDSIPRFRDAVDDLVYVHAAQPFGAVGRWYDEFSQVSDDGVVAFLRKAAEEHRSTPATATAARS